MLPKLRVDRVAMLLVLSGIITTPYAKNASAQLSSLGAYGRLSTWCGPDPIPRDTTALPSIGCFILSPGHMTTGVIAGHQIEVSVDEKGQEVFIADGIIITTNYDPQKTPPRFSNLPYAHTMGIDGYAFCSDAAGSYCPSDINVFSRNPDKTVLFYVSKCLLPDYRICVNTQENWNYEISRRK